MRIQTVVLALILGSMLAVITGIVIASPTPAKSRVMRAQSVKLVAKQPRPIAKPASPVRAINRPVYSSSSDCNLMCECMDVHDDFEYCEELLEM